MKRKIYIFEMLGLLGLFVLIGPGKSQLAQSAESGQTHAVMLPMVFTPGIDQFPDGAEILPLGDSRVAGNRPIYESYRYELWKNMIDKGWSFDFVGSQSDPADYGNYGGQAFDRNHEGLGGATTAMTLETVIALLEGAAPGDVPDVVLLGIGGNDYLTNSATPEEALANVNQMIDLFQAANPDIIIFVEQIAPAQSVFMTPLVQQIFDLYSAGIAQTAIAQTDARSTVIAVDIASDWSDSYFADQIHYNEAGAKAVADRYAAAMEEFFIIGGEPVTVDEK